MNSPIFLKIIENIPINHTLKRPIYLQLADGLLELIKCGKLSAGQKLPGSRDLAILLKINRITVKKAIDELAMQGWINSVVGKGTFVSQHIVGHSPKQLPRSGLSAGSKSSGFLLPSTDYLPSYTDVKIPGLHLDDGYPDPTLAPLKELYRAYRIQLTRSGLYHKFGSYGHPAGSAYYRKTMSDYLNTTRGLKTTDANILSVRGTLMGINLVSSLLIAPGDVVVSGVPGWRRAEHNFIYAKAKHIGIPVDEHGINVEALKSICKKHNVRMLYLTPHHHYPTTVSLRIDRRLEILKLASQHGFIILEDDYDFDFHYRHRPLMPLASADENGMVIYCGSFSKSFSPAFRMGYLVAAENVIQNLTKVRVLLDRQGDHILDNAMADIINDGTIQRYLRRTLPVYEQRRNLFCQLMREELDSLVTFREPEGGMSVWTTFDRKINLKDLIIRAYSKGLLLCDGNVNLYPNLKENAIRLGFASSGNEELIKSVDLIKLLIK